MRLLLLQLQQQSHAERDESLEKSTPLVFADDSVPVSQFKLTSSGIEQLLYDICIVAIELVDQLDPQQTKRVVRASGVLYLAAMNRLVKMLSGRQSARDELVNAAPLCLPMHLISTSVLDFVLLVAYHKH